MTAEDTPRTCPSARAAPGATLLGILGGDGRMVPLRTSMRVDQDFLNAAGPRPEARMRFASGCVKGHCAQWTGRNCGVIERVLGHLGVPEAAPLPPCLIRGTCRWFAEQGAAACGVCDRVVTDNAAVPVA